MDWKEMQVKCKKWKEMEMGRNGTEMERNEGGK